MEDSYENRELGVGEESYFYFVSCERHLMVPNWEILVGGG